jgi:GNAT superfamily N-acetyltransferase
VILRAATAADVPTLADIWLDSAFGSDPPVGVSTHYLAHEVATGISLIAEEGGRAVGFGILHTRGAVSNLGELFVRRSIQSKGIGAAILEPLMKGAEAQAFTVAANDPRALALYVRHGMAPRWPYWYLRGEQAGLDLPPCDVAAIETSWDDPLWPTWDRLIAGRDRATEHPYLRATCGGVPLWFRRGGITVGYGCVQLAGQSKKGDVAFVGPLGAIDAESAVGVAVAAACFALVRRRIVRIDVPGPHAAVRTLLDAGFRIVDQDTFMSRLPPDFFDPTRYTPLGAEFF